MTGRSALAAVLILVGLALAQPVWGESRREATVTHYGPTGNPTTSGRWPVEGWTVSCSYDLPMDTWISIGGVWLQCHDRGPGLRPTHVDIFCETAACREWATSMWPRTMVEVE